MTGIIDCVSAATKHLVVGCGVIVRDQPHPSPHSKIGVSTIIMIIWLPYIPGQFSCWCSPHWQTEYSCIIRQHLFVLPPHNTHTQPMHAKSHHICKSYLTMQTLNTGHPRQEEHRLNTCVSLPLLCCQNFTATHCHPPTCKSQIFKLIRWWTISCPSNP